jgi:DNA-binding response OmpR family regulator
MKKVLVVDDQTEVREFLTDFLSLKGFDVVQASNGKQAMEVFEHEHPDVAIVDVEMPVLNGLQFSKKILAENSDFPILIITAFLKKYDDSDFLDIGVRNILTKPIDLNTLYSEIQKALN